MKNYGFQQDTLAPEDYIFGGKVQLGGEVLQPDGQWNEYLPDVEIQNLNGIEPFACVSFATLNIVEILERRLYGTAQNWSDRFLATISGTKGKNGNTPKTVGQALRDNGCPPELDWAFDEKTNTYDKFYTDITKQIKTLALAFKAEYDFGYQYIPSDYDAIINQLQYSPVGFSAYAWTSEDGIYYRPQGTTDSHFVACYGYEKNRYWKIFDSYSNNGTVLKKVRWNSLPMQATRYTLHRQIVVESAWDRFVKLLRALLGYA